MDTSAPQSTISAVSSPSTAGARGTSVHGLLLTSVLMVVVLAVFTGLIYPFGMLGIGQLFFNHQANGSLVTNARGQVIGSQLIGQSFSKPRYFHPRLSAAGNGYDASASGGTNLGPTNKVLLQRTLAQARLIRKQNHLPPTYPLPADAVFSSASGLDPDISIAYADLQIPRVAQARGMSRSAIQTLVNRYSSYPFLGIIGQPRVNVFELNLALDRTKK